MVKERILLIVILAFALDGLLGDPYGWPHPVRGIGRMIAKAESLLRNLLPRSKWGEHLGGGILVIAIGGSTYTLTWLLLAGLERVSAAAAFLAEVWLCYQILAARSLQQESRRVYEALAKGDLQAARAAVAMIVGRDTQKLDFEGVTKAAIETVAENTSDGVIAPLFYMLLGGAPLGLLYKSINTMDSMLGYKNARYQYFGWCAAKLDDLANLLPARLSGLFMVLAAFILGYDGRQAWQIFRRDRLRHASPNSAHTEAACAGALGIQLAGDAYYFGQLHAKPTIGDANRPVEDKDIIRANRLMIGSTILAIIILGIIRLGFIRWLIG